MKADDIFRVASMSKPITGGRGPYSNGGWSPPARRPGIKVLTAVRLYAGRHSMKLTFLLQIPMKSASSASCWPRPGSRGRRHLLLFNPRGTRLRS